MSLISTKFRAFSDDLNIFKQELQSRLIDFKVVSVEKLRLSFSVPLFGQDCWGYLEGESIVGDDIPQWAMRAFGFFWADRKISIVITVRHKDKYFSIREYILDRSLYSNLSKCANKFVSNLVNGIKKVEEAKRFEDKI